MELESSGQTAEARDIYQQAWEEATADLERFLAAFYLARTAFELSDRTLWLERCLEHALALADDAVRAALPPLYTELADAYRKVGNAERAAEMRECASAATREPRDSGPFYHGTRAALQIGDVLTPGNRSNYDPSLTMNHIYFTALVNGAGLAAALAQGDGEERVYVVEPMDAFEDDPNVTNKKFPGNPTRSYRTSAPLRIVGEVKEWNRITAEVLKQWRERIAKTSGKIIN